MFKRKKGVGGGRGERERKKEGEEGTFGSF